VEVTFQTKTVLGFKINSNSASNMGDVWPVVGHYGPTQLYYGGKLMTMVFVQVCYYTPRQ
jgi:hypothetical protein